MQRPSSDASKPEQRIYGVGVSTGGSDILLIVNSLCAFCSTGTQWLYAASAPVGCNSCAVEDHHAGLAGVLDTCHRQAVDTCPDAAGVEGEVR